MSLPTSPEKIERFKEIAITYNPNLPKLYNELKPEERVFIYYMFRASLPGNHIVAGQYHRNTIEVIELFEEILLNEDEILKKDADAKQLLDEIKTYLVYLWSNHGPYFLREYTNHKRTPSRLELANLNPENLIKLLKLIDYKNPEIKVQELEKSISDENHEPTLCIDGNIEQSGGNFYSHDFTEEDYKQVPENLRNALNAYFYIDYENGKRVPKVELYKIGGRFSKELEASIYWLKKAYEHVLKYPQTFDKHFPASLDYLIKYLETGDEEYFKKHSVEWLKTKSRVDFTFGFIEVYEDPKQRRGTFEADVTIKSIDIEKLNHLLPVLERQLPFPKEFQRKNIEDLSAIPNASINTIAFGAGDMGPLKILAAYCLPNYNEIRSEHGSKQIIYQAEKSLGEKINPYLWRRLFHIKEQAEWLEQYDANDELYNDISNVHTILHETLGHGSGSLHVHTFKEGDNLAIGDKTYKVGDTVQVTSKNITEFIGSYYSSLEELRAEINALYSVVFLFDDLAKSGLFNDWPNKIGKDELIKHAILEMAGAGLRRLLNQADDATEVSGAHAQADNTIMNYLLDHGGMELIEENYEDQGHVYKVLGLRITDIQRTLENIKNLTILVQTLKSTADGQGVKELIDIYGKRLRKQEYIKILKDNRKAVIGDLKTSAYIYPRYIPVLNENSEIIDIKAEWPDSFVGQQLEFKKLMFEKE